MVRSVWLMVVVIVSILSVGTMAQTPDSNAAPGRDTEGQAQDASEMRAESDTATGDDDDIDDLIVERAGPIRRVDALESTPTGLRPQADGGPDLPDVGAPVGRPRFRKGKDLDFQSLTGAPTRPGNCGTFWTGWIDSPDSDVNPCPAHCSRGERLQSSESQGATGALYNLQFQCYLIPAVAMGQSSSRSGVEGVLADQTPVGTVSPAAGAWGARVALTAPGLAAMHFVRAEWYPEDDASQTLAGMITATVRARTPPDTVEIEMPMGAGGMMGAVVRLFAAASADAGTAPLFIGRFTITEASAARRLAPDSRIPSATGPTSPPPPQPVSEVRPVAPLTPQTLGGAPAMSAPPPAVLEAPPALRGSGASGRAVDAGEIEDRLSAAGPILAAVDVTAYSVTAVFQPVSGPASYQVFATEEGAREPVAGNVIEASAATGNIISGNLRGSVEGLTTGFRYSVWVQARYPDGRSGVSENREVTLGDAVNPQVLRAIRVGERGAELSWDAVSGVTGYRIDGSNAAGVQVAAPPLVIADLGDGNHSWRVMSVYGRGVYNDVTARSVSLLIESPATMVARAFDAGQARYPDAGPDPERWKRLALATGSGYDQLVASFPSLWVITQAYQYLLDRDATAAESAAHIQALDGGRDWREVWREIAQSTEREQRFGHWSPAPIGDLGQARIRFNQSGLNNGQACYGGLGDGCDSPEVGDPEWDTGFALPDGTRMGFVTINVAVGSILHDNACLKNRHGLHCDNQAWHWVAEHVPSPVVAVAISPAAIEWNKASWNVFDGRKWRERFGPYPIDRNTRRADWYDDLRDVQARTAFMAPVFASITVPVQSERYTGMETRRTRAIGAPAGTSLDSKDSQFCKSGAFSRTESFIGKADWGFCR